MPGIPDKNVSKISSILNELNTAGIDHKTATDQLFILVFGELHSLASRLMKQERQGHSLQTTALVHEAYLQLVREDVQNWENQAHFFGVAARAMRQILVDHARKKQAAKRGGGWARITLHDNMGISQHHSELHVLDVDSALTQLSEQHHRMAQIAELRIFGGLKMKEVAHVLGVSRSTVQGDWRVAKMWLNRMMEADQLAREAN